MSKMGLIRQQRGVYGDPAFPLIGGIVGAAKAALGAVGIGTLARSAAALAKRGIVKYGVPTAAAVALGRATAKKNGAPATGFRRRGKGISASELRGFKKINRLLWCVGMVPKKSRQRRTC